MLGCVLRSQEVLSGNVWRVTLSLVVSPGITEFYFHPPDLLVSFKPSGSPPHFCFVTSECLTCRRCVLAEMSQVLDAEALSPLWGQDGGDYGHRHHLFQSLNKDFSCDVFSISKF